MKGAGEMSIVVLSLFDNFVVYLESPETCFPFEGMFGFVISHPSFYCSQKKD